MTSAARNIAIDDIGRAAASTMATQPPKLCLHLAEWGFSTPALRARAAALDGISLLSDVRLAELMGVTDQPLVMDGIAWR